MFITKSALLILIPVVLSLVFVILLEAHYRQLSSDLAREQKTREALHLCQDLVNSFAEPMTYTGLALNSSFYADKTKTALAAVDAKAKRVQRYADEGLIDRELADALLEKTKRMTGLLLDSSNLVGDNKMPTTSALLPVTLMQRSGDVKVTLDELQRLGQKALLQESTLEGLHNHKTSRLSSMQVVFAGVLINVVGVCIAGWLLYKQFLVRLLVLQTNAARFPEGTELLPELSGHDELAEVDTEFRSMVQAIRLAREKELALANNVRDCVCSLDKDGKILHGNAVAEHWQVVSHVLPDLAADSNDKSQLEAFIKDCQPGTTAECQVSLLVAEQSTPCRLRGTLVGSEIFLVARDISVELRTEEFKQKLLRMIGHDIRTPLSAILLNIQMVDQYNTVSEAGTERLSNAQRSIKSIVTVLTDLLDLEKVESGSAESQPQDNDLQIIITEAQEEIEMRFPHLAIHTDGPDIKVLADRDSLLRAFTGVIKYYGITSATEKNIHLRWAAGAGDGNVEVIFSSCENPVFGANIPQVLDRFSNYHEVSGGGVSVALSLALARAIIESQNGTLRACEEDQGGIGFIAVLPAVAAVAQT